MRDLVAKDVMNSELLTVPEDMTVAELAQFLVENEISGVPVQNATGHLVGVVSLSDVARSLTGRDEAVLTHGDSDYYLRSWEERFNAEDIAGLRVAESDETVGEIMTPSVLAVDEEMPISKVAARMIDSRIHRLLVTRDHKVVGILSTTDLLGLLVDDEEN
jgi:CBS domain-containing protein